MKVLVLPNLTTGTLVSYMYCCSASQVATALYLEASVEMEARSPRMRSSLTQPAQVEDR